MSNLLKIESEFDVIKVACVDFLTIKQATNIVAMYKNEAIKLAEWILENVKEESEIEEV